MKKKIAILTDSSAGFTDEEAKKLNIYVIPLHIIINGEMDILDTEQETEKNNFYEHIRTGTTKTSQASVGEVGTKYDELLEKYEQIIHYPIAEKLSSQYASAYALSQEDKYKDKVHVVCNHTAAYALKVLTIYAKQLADEKLSASEIIKKTNAFAEEILMAMIPGDLNRLSSGGRARKLLISLISLFKIKILLQWGENPKRISSSRTVSNLVNDFGELFKKFKSKIKDQCDLFVLKTSECSNKVWTSCTTKLSELDLHYQVTSLPNVFPAHAGLDTIAFVALPHQEKEKK